MIAPLLICLDFQNAFLQPGVLCAPNAPRVLLEARRILGHARRTGWNIAHCRLQRAIAPFCVFQNAARQIDGFEPRATERVFDRDSLSPYEHEDFDALMDDFQDPGVFVVSLATLTLLSAALDASRRGHRFYFSEDAIAGQPGLRADAGQHESVAADLLAALGFLGAAHGGAEYVFGAPRALPKAGGLIR